MNKNDIDKLENLYKLVTNLSKYQYFLEELIEKEKIKREKHIANVKKYNSNNSEYVENKEVIEDNDNNTEHKTSILETEKFQKLLRDFREKQRKENNTDTQNDDNSYTSDLD